MARLRFDFSLFPRKLPPSKKFPAGRSVWVYRTYTPDDARTAPRSTGIEVDDSSPSRFETSRKKAEKFCNDLMKSGRLWQGGSQKFAAYSEGWFEEGKCVWLDDRIAAGTSDRPGLSQSYIRTLKMMLRVHIKPFFDEKRIESINASAVKQFRAELKKKDLANKSINTACDVFRIMTDSMLADGLLVRDPFATIKRFDVEKSIRRAFSLSEAWTVLHGKWSSRRAWLFNLTAAITGLRVSEVRSIRADTLHETHIDVIDQMIKNELSIVKTKESRKVPIPKELYQLLSSESSKGYIFASHVDGLPLSRHGAIQPLAALAPDPALCFHSWRHFANTWLMSENVPPAKVRAVMGHSEGRGTMTATYTDWRPEMFPEVYAAQEKLIKILLSDVPPESKLTIQASENNTGYRKYSDAGDYPRDEV